MSKNSALSEKSTALCEKLDVVGPKHGLAMGGLRGHLSSVMASGGGCAQQSRFRFYLVRYLG
jgi:hypothetical protein